MKRVSGLILTIIVVVALSSLITTPATADKTKKKAGKNIAKGGPRQPRQSSVPVGQNREVPRITRDSQSSLNTEEDVEQDPDLPPGMRISDKNTYMRLREEYVARLRGIEPGMPSDPQARGRAIRQMERQEFQRASAKNLFMPNAVEAAWTPLGPAPLPNGPFTGRVKIGRAHV